MSNLLFRTYTMGTALNYFSAVDLYGVYDGVSTEEKGWVVPRVLFQPAESRSLIPAGFPLMDGSLTSRPIFRATMTVTNIGFGYTEENLTDLPEPIWAEVVGKCYMTNEFNLYTLRTCTQTFDTVTLGDSLIDFPFFEVTEFRTNPTNYPLEGVRLEVVLPVLSDLYRQKGIGTYYPTFGATGLMERVRLVQLLTHTTRTPEYRNFKEAVNASSVTSGRYYAQHFNSTEYIDGYGLWSMDYCYSYGYPYAYPHGMVEPPEADVGYPAYWAYVNSWEGCLASNYSAQTDFTLTTPSVPDPETTGIEVPYSGNRFFSMSYDALAGEFSRDLWIRGYGHTEYEGVTEEGSYYDYRTHQRLRMAPGDDTPFVGVPHPYYWSDQDVPMHMGYGPALDYSVLKRSADIYVSNVTDHIDATVTVYVQYEGDHPTTNIVAHMTDAEVTGPTTDPWYVYESSFNFSTVHGSPEELVSSGVTSYDYYTNVQVLAKTGGSDLFIARYVPPIESVGSMLLLLEDHVWDFAATQSGAWEGVDEEDPLLVNYTAMEVDDSGWGWFKHRVGAADMDVNMLLLFHWNHSLP